MRKHPVTFALAIFLVAIVGLGYWYRTGMSTFDEAMWKSMRGNFALDNPRQNMANEVISKVATVGRTRPEIVAALGEPEKAGPRQAHYYLGVGPTSVGELYLIVEFDERSVVSRAYITRK